MTTFSSILNLIVLFSLNFVAVFSYADIVEEPRPILVYGDSLSAGYGLQRGEEWPVLLQNYLDDLAKDQFHIVNASISGETTQGGLLRFKKTFDTYKPAFVILELGANDGLRGQSIKTMQSNLAAMIQYSHDHQAKVILAGMHIPPNYGKRYAQSFHKAFERLKSEHNITLIPFLLESVALNDDYRQADGLHPTAEAQPLIMKTVAKSLKPLLQLP